MFGSAEKFGELQKNAKETKNPDQFLSADSTIYTGWIIKKHNDHVALIKVYWTDSFYYISEKKHILGPNHCLSPEGLTWQKQEKSNALPLAILTLLQVMIAFVIFLQVELHFEKRIDKIMRSNLRFPAEEEISQKLAQKGGRVKIYDTTVVYQSPLKKTVLGKLYYSGEKGLCEFLDKFGRREKFEELMDEQMGMAESAQWVIDYRVLIAGYNIYKEDAETLRKLTEKASTPKEFLMVAGVR